LTVDTPDEAHNERAKRLANRSSDQLASFIFKLAQDIDGVDERIEAFLASDNSQKAAQLAKRQLMAFRRSRKIYDYRRAHELSGHLDQFLDLVETAVLPADSSAAFHLIVKFIECDAHAIESADDSDGTVGGVFQRACGLFARAAKNLPSMYVLPVLQRLLAANDYGTRDYLLDGVGEFLDRPHLDAFMAETRAAIAAGGESARRSRCHLQSIAESIQDPVLFEEATYAGREHELPPNVAVDVARHFLEAGRPNEALEKLPPSAEGLHGFTSDYLELRVRILQALGDAEGLRPTLWARFAHEPSRETLRELLAAEPPDTRASKLDAAFEHVRGRLPPQGQAEFFAEVGELNAAASVIVGAPNKLNGDHYDGLVALAEQLEMAYPLAASLAYRALLDSILRRAAPKSYYHGGRYWRIMHELSGRIDDWKGLEPHLAYRERIGREHARKTAFWRAVKQELWSAVGK
jgi:tetratricopeptide (TPR) repeat protein